MCFEPGVRCCGVREGLVALSANVVYSSFGLVPDFMTICLPSCAVYGRYVTSHICPRRYVINLERYVTKHLDDLSQIYFKFLFVVHAFNINRWLFALLFALI